jgi:hypothetical protein
MIVKKYFSMDLLIDLAMTRLFQLAEYVSRRFPFVTMEPAEPVVSQEIAPTIRFSNEDRMVEGELFK